MATQAIPNSTHPPTFPLSHLPTFLLSYLPTTSGLLVSSSFSLLVSWSFPLSPPPTFPIAHAARPTPQSKIAKTTYPAASCMLATAVLPPAMPAMTSMSTRTWLPASAMTKATKTSASRAPVRSRASSPAAAPTMSAVCSERKPLHASSTPTVQLVSVIVVPAAVAGYPSRWISPTDHCVTNCIKGKEMAFSTNVGHGIPSSMKAAGNKSLRSAALPPVSHATANVLAKAMSPTLHKTGRQ